MPLHNTVVFSQSFEIHALIYSDKQQQRQVSVFIEEQEFHTAIDGQAAYAHIARWVAGQRRQFPYYDVFLSDLEFSTSYLAHYPGQQAGSVRFIQQKLQVEQAINKAMASLKQ